MRWVRLLGWLAVTAAMLTVPLAVALWWWRSTTPAWPSGSQLKAWLAEPLTANTIVVGVVLLGLALWTALAVLMATLVLRELRTLWVGVKRIGLPTPAQATATSLAGMAVFGVPGTGLATSTHVSIPTPPVPSAPHEDAGEDTALPDTAAGVTLPGGWLPLAAAQAVAFTAGLWWRRRRRDYRPGNRTTRDDEMLPQTVSTVQALTPAGPAPAAGQAVFGQRANQPLLIEELPAEGIGLVGPGAPDAVRGVLVAALLAHPGVSVTITRADLIMLLGARGGWPMSGLTVVDGFDAAVTELENTRRRLPAFATVAEQDGDSACHVRRLMIGQAPLESVDVERLHAALAASGTVAVLLGSWAPGGSRHINADGTVRGQNGPGQPVERWAVLDVHAAADLLVLARPAEHARPSNRPVQVPAPAGAPPAGEPLRRGADRTVAVLQVLGPPVIAVNGVPIVIRRAAAVQALVYLAVHRSGATSHELALRLWPGEPPHVSAPRLYTTISELRRTLTLATGHVIVQRNDDRYQLDPALVDVDLWDLQDTVTEARYGAGTPQAWQRIIAGYPAELAAGKAWPWVLPHRDRVRRDVLDAHVALADTSEPAHAFHLLQAAHAIDPYNEDVARRVIALLAERGEYGRIAGLIDDIERRLHAEGLQPSPDFTTFTGNLPYS